MTTTQTPVPTSGAETPTAGVIVHCQRCGAVLLILQNGTTAVKGAHFVCGRCGRVRVWAKRRRPISPPS